MPTGIADGKFAVGASERMKVTLLDGRDGLGDDGAGAAQRKQKDFRAHPEWPLTKEGDYSRESRLARQGPSASTLNSREQTL